MTNNLNEVWKCQVCGNIVELVHVGGGPLVCCGQAMNLMAENTMDAALEKHVPVIEITDAGYLVKVGAVAHPMEEVHYIEWIELMVGEDVYRQYLKPGDAPEALFEVPEVVAQAAEKNGEKIWAREYCNLHGLWSLSS